MQGSIFWMAPEGEERLLLGFRHKVEPVTYPYIRAVIHNNKQGYSAKADIWSLGCICIEMLAGSRPWEGEGFMGAMFKVSGRYPSCLRGTLSSFGARTARSRTHATASAT